MWNPFAFLVRIWRSRKEVCPHCGEVGWGNRVGCNALWESYINAPYEDDDNDQEAD